MAPTNKWVDDVQGEEKQVSDEQQQQQQQTAQSQHQNENKEYVRGPVLGTQVYQPTTQPQEYYENDYYDERTDLVRPGRKAVFKFEMEEGGSKTLQFVAATAGMIVFFFFFLFTSSFFF